MKRLIRARGVYGLERSSSEGTGILINGTNIESIGGQPFPDEIPSLDCGSCMIAPLFTDFHLHFFKRFTEEIGFVSDALLRAGIGTAYEGGDRQMNGMKVKVRLKGRINLKCSGCAISLQGGYGADLGIDVRTVEEAKRTIVGLVSRGIDYVKVINSGIFLPETGTISPGGWDASSLMEIVCCAKEQGLEVFCHANGDEAVRDAVHAGASMIIHGFFASTDTLSLMRDRGVALVPTIAALSGLRLITRDPSGRARLQDMVDRHIEMMAYAVSAGVRVLPGSDAGASFLHYGDTFTDELQFLVRAGLSPEDIIEASLDNPVGPGLSADFLVLEGLKVKKVFLKGECVFESNE